MSRRKNRVYFSYAWRRILQFFFQGVIVLAPIGITLYLVLWLFNSIDSILPNILDYIAPVFGKDPLTPFRRVPGIGFILVILLVVLVGWLSSLFFIERIVEILDKILERTPGIKFIYTSIKDFLEAFAGNKRKFDKPVLVNVDAENVWRIGFITQKDASHFTLPDHLVVYVPHSYAISGITYIVPKDRVKLLDTPAPEAMKFVVSGGVTDLD